MSPAQFSSVITPLIGSDISHAYAQVGVLDGVSIICSPGQRVGLVGENGSGKSTLLRILAGIQTPDAGQVRRPEGLVFLAQEPNFASDATIAQVLAQALAPLHDAVADLERLGADLAERPDDAALADDFAKALEFAETHDAWDAERRATVAAHQLGLDLHPERLVATLSGGQQMRLALAVLIAQRPTCVVMDEPTNHLDDRALAVLEDFLRELPGVVVVSSHDRTFLDRVCTQLVDLDENPLGVDGVGGNTFTGTFTDYPLAKNAARARWEQTWAEQQQELRELREAVRQTAPRVAHNRGPSDPDKFIYAFKGANVERAQARRIAAAEAKLATAEAQQVRKPRPRLTLSLPASSAAASATEVSVRNLVVTGRARLERLDVETGHHLLLSGANGSGKSTVLRVLAGELLPDAGTVQIRGGQRAIGYLPQDVTFDDPTRTAWQLFHNADTTVGLAELGLLAPASAIKPVGDLSVGQRRRLALALIVARQPRILLLDEPTNHISLTLANELEEALAASPATVIVATHDRWLRARWNGLELTL